MAKAKVKNRLNERDIEQLEQIGAIRLPIDQTWSLLGFNCKATYERAFKKSEAAREAFERGRAKASNTTRTTLFRLATEDQYISEETEVLVEEKYYDPLAEKTVIRKVPRTLKKRKNIGKSVDALKFWCETQENFKRTKRIELERANAIDAEFEDLTDEQIEERMRRAEKALRR